ncbi:hypothetical protein [Acholeplasma hippikon]|uniref:Uncharacterized protein n=1 Tax=Acholeplasma hippikon TaxID=264636 RepID=A0A449BJA4_9MOLU|nr:hypothetical protein [Acholeplasma hippikon]VEU82545.1 Uncharacterised protein [Acholeplasma hippikon]
MKKIKIFVALLFVLILGVTVISLKPQALAEDNKSAVQVGFDDVGPDLRNPIGKIEFAGGF